MVVTCQACGAANDDQARFCDQCGATLHGALAELAGAKGEGAATPSQPLQASEVTQPPLARPVANVNWAGLSMIAIVLCGLGYLFFGNPGNRAATNTAPMASGADPGAAFAEAQQQLKAAKDRLAKDALDVEALKEMYGLYGQIGQAEKVREQLHASLEELKARIADKRLDQEGGIKLALDMAMAAMTGDDAIGAADALKLYYEFNPKRVSTAAMLGNIYYDVGMAADALQWYDEYLSKADQVTEGASYLAALVDRETVRMTLAAERKQPDLLAQAAKNLERISGEHPESWAALFNLGQAYLQQGDKAKAIETWKKCLPLAKNPEDKWRTDAALAEAEGRPAPPPPTQSSAPALETVDPAKSPHGGMEPGTSSNGESPPSGTNPHGGM